MGSPVDVAKSYMRARPPWASPSTNNFEFKSPSPSGLQLFKEETSYSISGNPLSSSKVPFYPLNYAHDASEKNSPYISSSSSFNYGFFTVLFYFMLLLLIYSDRRVFLL